MPGPKPHRFDWDEARRLRGEGMTYRAIAERLGVSPSAVRFVVLPETRVRNANLLHEWQKNGVCPQCGGKASRNHSIGQHLCTRCNALKLVKIRDGEAYCAACAMWKPLDAFSPTHERLVRTVHGICRSCANAQRRGWRERHHSRSLIAERARTAVRTALKHGKLQKPSCCSACGREGRVEGHHDDYDKPLMVRWLCMRCHRRFHRKVLSPQGSRV